MIAITTATFPITKISVINSAQVLQSHKGSCSEDCLAVRSKYSVNSMGGIARVVVRVVLIVTAGIAEMSEAAVLVIKLKTET